MDRAGVSCVIPLWNEEGSLPHLHAALVAALKGLNRDYEVVYVDDGSTDGSRKVLEALYDQDATTQVISLRGHYGKSAALMAGFRHARFPIVVTLDADLQDEPQEIPKLLETLEQGFDMVTGWKRVRHDPWLKVVSSRLFNWVTSLFTGIRLHDYNSGFKAYRREVLAELDIYGELHRFIPALLGLRHFTVAEVPVQHNPRQFGRTKFGPERFINGFLDLLTVMFLSNYLKTPLHLFGRIGLLFFTTGFLINSYITYLKALTGTIQFHYPLLVLGTLLLIMGVQFVCTGLLGELISKANRRDADRFVIRAHLTRHPHEPGGFTIKRRQPPE
ncbi:MAG: glycosyltransferase family 2 protein [Candidatus Riflebacteria bacterium]|nr:glycosyltransferase family 2 protein [Candidatus Riflebacteria bacterium]